jgi:nucleotide-binding universal stress UspA family protein
MKILVPVDGSETSSRAIDHLLKKAAWHGADTEIHLLNVQHSIPYGSRVSAVIGREALEQYHREEGLAALQPARAKLDAAGLKYQFHILVGEPAEKIVQYARENGCEQIFMGTHGRGAVSKVLLGSVASKVVALSDVPVVLVK